MSVTHFEPRKQRNQPPVIRGIAFERLAAAGMVLVVVLCGLMLSPTVKQSAAAFEKIDAHSQQKLISSGDHLSTEAPQSEHLALPENIQEKNSISSSIIDRICRKLEFGFRLVGGTEISTIIRLNPH